MNELHQNQNKTAVKEIIERQRKYFIGGATRDMDFRIRQLKILRDVIVREEDRILEALKKDLGKCKFEGYVCETGMVINEINYMIKNIRRFSAAKKVKTPLIFFGGKSYIVSEPLGVTLVIGPWNYPFQLTLMPIVGTMAAGNCAIIKPPEMASNTSEIICKIIRDSFPEEYVTVIPGGVETSTELLKNKFDYIFFTGGTSVGKIVMEAAAGNLTPVTLELGGKSPCIFENTANIKNAARRIAWGKFLNAGQTCVAPDYLLVHKKVKDDLVGNIIKSIEEFYGKDPELSQGYSRIINEKHFDRVSSLLRDGNILYGGKIKKEKLYISPTIMDSVSLESNIMNEEIFGPILPVLEYDELEEAIRFINSKPKPLALYIFSTNKRSIRKVLYGTSSGGACINDTINHITTHYLPFGGVGESGIGSYHGKTSFDIFTHKKSVLHNSMAFDLSAKYPPYKIPISTFKKFSRIIMR